MDEHNYVWVVGEMDYGDNGWSIKRIFLSREEADKYISDNPLTSGYWKIEKHILGDNEGDMYGSWCYEE